MSAPRRNIEVKALDPDPERSLAVCRDLGADDMGVLTQRDTYFRTNQGRLKLREEEAGGGDDSGREEEAGGASGRETGGRDDAGRGAGGGGATLVQYVRPDEARARLSSYRLIPVDDPKALKTALNEALGTLVVVEKERHLFLLDGVRIHLDKVTNLGTFVELEGVAPADSDLQRETAKVAHLMEHLEIGPDRILTDSYSDRLLGPDALIEAARAVMMRAYAPYSRYVVGAALRADDGSIHVGANVENSAYPQGQCAEASAIGAMVAAGRTRIVEAAVIAGANEFCVPCGGCRQRLREFMPLDATIHLCGASGAHETATLEELLPRSFGPEYLPG